MAGQIVRALRTPFQVNGTRLDANATIGVRAARPTRPVTDLQRAADIAM